MRGLVIDHLRSKSAAKRGGGLDFTSLNTALSEQLAHPENLQSLSDVQFKSGSAGIQYAFACVLPLVNTTVQVGP